VSRMPEFKKPRGSKHFIYVNRTNFGLYNILHQLGALIRTDTYPPEVVDPIETRLAEAES